MADALQAFRQYVHEEAANELASRECHGLPALGSFDAIVLVSERDAAVADGHEPTVRDRHAMRVAREIAQNLRRSSERRLAVDDPLGVPQRAEKALEGACVGEAGERIREAQATVVVRLCEHRNHLAAEHLRQHRDVHEEVAARGDPARAIRRETAARHVMCTCG